MSKLTTLIDLDFANKSWADIVFEEEEEENRRKEEEEERKKNKPKEKIKDAQNVWRDRLRSPAKNPLPKSTIRSSSKSRDKSSTDNKKLPQSPATKISTTGSRKILSPSKSYISPVKQDEKRNLRSSPAKNWRPRKVIDDDSQDTLTESARIKNAPVKRSHSSTVDDGETRFPPAIEEKRARRSDDQSTKRRSGPPKWFPQPEAWVEPKRGYESDPAIIARREKDINYGYKSVVYQKYISTIPRAERIKGMHPRTPNKYIKVPRRSWDTQIRLWRRMLYYVMDMEPATSDCSFLSSTSESSENQSANVSFSSNASGSDASDCLFGDGDFPPLYSECTEATITGSNTDNDGPTNFACLAVAAAR